MDIQTTKIALVKQILDMLHLNKEQVNKINGLKHHILQDHQVVLIRQEQMRIINHIYSQDLFLEYMEI